MQRPPRPLFVPLRPAAVDPALVHKPGNIVHHVTYITQVYIDEWVELTPDGVVTDAGPMLQLFVGNTIADIRTHKMVTRVVALDTVPTPPTEPTPVIELTDAKE